MFHDWSDCAKPLINDVINHLIITPNRMFTGVGI